ncbi:hypothetical protein RRG08_043434 [Elysia crispata]|uniref:Uncharacterized protein n=1 Tax=Elysia crispata TaxID=231223 RepID=A0AAE0YLS2_9GAST|nr:hypothetical protein RRG08_043434 [Elysia crispata]
MDSKQSVLKAIAISATRQHNIHRVLSSHHKSSPLISSSTVANDPSLPHHTYCLMTPVAAIKTIRIDAPQIRNHFGVLEAKHASNGR